ncbi:MAG: PDZ domain-containing protein [Nocardioides sp.]
MSQRLIAAFVAAPLVIALLLAAFLVPLPFVTYSAGYSVDVLDEDGDGTEIIQVEGQQTYRDEGEIRMTTVLVSGPQQQKNLIGLMGAWLDPDDAVYPYDAVYREGETEEENDIEGSVDMVSSQDSAVAVALTELGYDVKPAVQVLYVDPEAPANDRLRVRDIFLEVNEVPVETSEDLTEAITKAGAGNGVSFRVLRNGVERLVTVVPKLVDGRPQVGIQLGGGFVFPFDVSVNIDPNIGGPSAGLMFSLAIYDTLTPGSLTDGEAVAGTGTITPDGAVGPIGGIQQKIAGARADGAALFLVPPDNCDDAEGANNGDMRLVLAETMHDASEALEAWAADRDADLPSCADLEAVR